MSSPSEAELSLGAELLLLSVDPARGGLLGKRRRMRKALRATGSGRRRALGELRAARLITREPELLDTHMEEVRSGHDEEPEHEPPAPVGGSPAWDDRMDRLGGEHSTGVLSFVSPDGFPFSVRTGVTVDAGDRLVRIETPLVGAPLKPSRACLCVHDHDEKFTWQKNFHIRGDLVEDDAGWTIVPRKLVGGFELPPGSLVSRMRLNAKKMRRFRKVAKRELAKREG